MKTRKWTIVRFWYLLDWSRDYPHSWFPVWNIGGKRSLFDINFLAYIDYGECDYGEYDYGECYPNPYHNPYLGTGPFLPPLWMSVPPINFNFTFYLTGSATFHPPRFHHCDEMVVVSRYIISSPYLRFLKQYNEIIITFHPIKFNKVFCNFLDIRL